MADYDPFAKIPNAGGEDDALMAEAFGPLPRPTGTWTGAFSPADQYDITEVTAKAGRYLAAAHHAGLPSPRYISIGAGGMSGTEDGASTSINFQFSTASKVRAWADHFGAEVAVGNAGPHADLPGPRRHIVQVYAPAADEPMSLADVTEAAPSLADALKSSLAAHTEAAPADPPSCSTCGHMRGSHFREGCDADLEGGCPCTQYAIECPGLAAHTEAACDTIKAATQ